MAARGQSGDGVLEVRLRNLILGHSDTQPAQKTQNGDTQSPRQQPAAQPVVQSGQNKPPSPSAPDDIGGPGPSKTSRKRLNQAQRRQMSAQLSIPIDTRAPFHQSQRSYASPPSHQDQHQGARGGGGHHRREPRSATFRPPSRGNAIPSAPLTGVPFPSRSRHQSSLSYHGPMSTPNQSGWSQPPMHQGDPRLSYQMPGRPPIPGAPGMPFDGPPSMHSGHGSTDLISPGRPFETRPDELTAQSELLEGLCNTVVADAEIEPAEIMEKENFRIMIEEVARSAITEHERNENRLQDFTPENVQLKCFGSLASGFATKASDMDLGLLSPLSRIQPDAASSPIPRLVEKAFLDIGLGARLLTQTRVPIIKVCQKPTEELRLALLTERTKWEKGVTEDHDEDETHEGPDPPLVENIQAQPSVQSQEETAAPEQALQKFKQSETSSLSTYYVSAKRLLRRLGGRDITHSNLAEFKMEDVKLLNEVGLAFVEGLADIKLRDRLMRYRSLNRYDLTSQANNLRTLLGVFTQVEGEHMAILFESRPIQEKDRSREAAAESAVRSWRTLQDKSDFGRDPLVYQKELQLTVEQLKRISSLQVLLLSQAPNESAANYCSKALKLLHDLGGHDSRARADTILPTLIQHYIGGISTQAIREQVESFQQSHRVNNLRAIGRRHKSLQLAHEYEACLKKGLYTDEPAAKVRRYVDLLRAPIAKSPSPGYSNGMIPLPPDSAPLLLEMRLLGDPAGAAPNQPRDRYSSALEFPKSGVGVQCDINFSAHLAIQNTLLLRCYSHCDPRVRPLVLFVKHWAKVRRINSAYRGTLGSYGYALMMLHYLVNVAQPFVCPNLQQLARSPDGTLTPQQLEETVQCKGQNILFWRDEAEITRLARDNVLTQNREPIGHILRGFFEYYAKGGAAMSALPCRSFDWGRDVLSLRTHGGLLTKQAKGWTGAKTVVEVANSAAAPPTTATATADPIPAAAAAAAGSEQQANQTQQTNTTTAATAAVETKEVRYRYLFAIEDPFELDHNVARTVTHAGIVNIRDEFRRAWRIIRNAGRSSSSSQGGQGQQGQGQGQGQGGSNNNNNSQSHHGQNGGWRQEDLLDDVGKAEEVREREQFARLLEELHGVLVQEGGWGVCWAGRGGGGGGGGGAV
ncbi:hypothetical protein C8A00DRAFT_16194 [Chaetomidium leptoderma]|uniref:polynucleotide adenylyltransferase n=1 Tax=Chaetomidium leptoderma TaxID=669021 RepID=A0AAN6VJ40_9PEZI|nr:hypothetical protein C8A00DRAFT_16194 [Chaetomidium leptoderma]